MVGSFSKRNCDRVESARLSISFSETNKSTSCPRSRRTSATARPGKRCPPVPPHAMTAFIRWLSYPRGGAHLHCGALHVNRLQDAAPINADQETDPKQAGGQI